MHIQRHTNTSTHLQSAHKRNGDNQAQEPGWEAWKKGFVRDLAHTHKKIHQEKPIFTNLQKRFEHIELPAKPLDYFLLSNKSNINQSRICKIQWMCYLSDSRGVWIVIPSLPSWVHHRSIVHSFDALWACAPVYISSLVHVVPNVLPRSLCAWPRTCVHLLEEGHNHPIMRLVYLCHMISEEFVLLSF